MTIEQTETSIVNKVLNHYQDFDIAKVVISKYTFDTITSFGFQTLYFKDKALITLSANAEIGDEISELLKLRFEKQQKSNRGTITVYPNGRYESEFVWDEQAHLDYLLLDTKTAFSFIYDESYIKITDDLLTNQEWEKALVTIQFKNGNILPLQIEVDTGGEKKQFSVPIQNLPPEEYPNLIKRFEDICYLANEGELKAHFAPGWNTVLVYLDRYESFDFGQHVHFLQTDSLA